MILVLVIGETRRSSDLWNVHNDNQSVVNNTTNIESKLHKKHNSLAFHAVRWAVSANILRVGKVHTSENLTDPYTKLLSAYERDHRFWELDILVNRDIQYYLFTGTKHILQNAHIYAHHYIIYLLTTYYNILILLSKWQVLVRVLVTSSGIIRTLHLII